MALQTKAVVAFLLMLCLGLLSQNMKTTVTFSRALLANVNFDTIITSTGYSKPVKSKSFAIVYLMAGCDDSASSSCLGYLLNVLVAKVILDHHGYTSDVVAMIRMKEANTSIPQDEWLYRAGVKVIYLPSITNDNFALAQLDKFRVLTLLQYDRVLYLDADAIPLCNLEYLVSDEASVILSDYVAMGQGASPVTGSIFLVTPKEGEFERLMDLVQSRISSSFDPVEGWGHKITSVADEWKCFRQQGGRNWTFYGAHADQGLLYHYFKYMMKNWTLLYREIAETWRQVVVAEETADAIELEDGTSIARVNVTNNLPFGCRSPRYDRGPWAQYHLYADHLHFAGPHKPWLKEQPSSPEIVSALNESFTTREELWWYWMHQAQRKWNVSLPSQQLSRPSLGFTPKQDQLFGRGGADVNIPKRRA